MRLLVTGAQGFLGARVVEVLRTKRVTVIPTGRRQADGIISCNLMNVEDVRNLINSVAPDGIVHCAAQVPRTLNEYKDGLGADNNLLMLDNILAESACPIVYISSMTVYGIEHTRAVREEDAGDPTSAYGQGKLEGEKRIELDSRHGLAIRIPGLFGLPRRDGLIYNLMYAFKNGQQPRLPSGPILWAAMHVSDAAECIATLAISNVDRFEAVNVGYKGKQSIKYLVDLAGKACKREYDYHVKQPSFEFNLARAEHYDALPLRSFREALISFGQEI